MVATIRTGYYPGDFRDAPAMGGEDFESTVWWPLSEWGGEYELGDAMEIRRPHFYHPDKFALVPITVSPDGRPRVSIRCKSLSLSQVIASVAYGCCPRGLLVRHLDDNVSNSYPSNLAYGTQKDNIADSLRNGTFPIGSRNGRARLNEEMVREIRRRGGGTTHLAREFGVDPKTIRNVLDGKLWKHVS